MRLVEGEAESEPVAAKGSERAAEHLQALEALAQALLGEGRGRGGVKGRR